MLSDTTRSQQDVLTQKWIKPTYSPHNEGETTATVQHDENIEAKGTEDVSISPERLAKAVRRVDLRVVPVMMILLAFSFIDRSNMGLAVVAGMSTELKFEGYDYSLALLVFFPGYALAVLPSNYILQRVLVRYWLTFVCIAFGLFTLGSGLIRNQAGLLAMRVLLGFAEAG